MVPLLLFSGKQGQMALFGGKESLVEASAGSQNQAVLHMNLG